MGHSLLIASCAPPFVDPAAVVIPFLITSSRNCTFQSSTLLNGTHKLQVRTQSFQCSQKRELLSTVIHHTAHLNSIIYSGDNRIISEPDTPVGLDRWLRDIRLKAYILYAWLGIALLRTPVILNHSFRV